MSSHPCCKGEYHIRKSVLIEIRCVFHQDKIFFMIYPLMVCEFNVTCYSVTDIGSISTSNSHTHHSSSCQNEGHSFLSNSLEQQMHHLHYHWMLSSLDDPILNQSSMIQSSDKHFYHNNITTCHITNQQREKE